MAKHKDGERFVRGQVPMELKPNGGSDFIRTVKSDLLPPLRVQNGFRDEITSIGPQGKNVVTFHLRHDEESAESYGERPYSVGFRSGSSAGQAFGLESAIVHNIAAKSKAA